jgi:nitrogen fixation NifU-like protein
MSNIRELYQEIILEHNKRPRNYRSIPDADRKALGHNPLCGDRLNVYLKMDGDTIADVAFEGAGCAISKASASLMTTVVKGQKQADAEKMVERFRRLVSGEEVPGDNVEELGKLDVFSGVSEFPARVKCASLAWHTLKAALDSKETPVSTEGNP